VYAFALTRRRVGPGLRRRRATVPEGERSPRQPGGGTESHPTRPLAARGLHELGAIFCALLGVVFYVLLDSACLPALGRVLLRLNERSFRSPMPLFSPSSKRSKAALPPSASDATGGLGSGTRRRILEVALHLFATRGFAGTSVRDLANVLELQPSALYAHFKSKDHILAELARYGYEAHEAAIRAGVDAAPEEPVERMRAFVRAHSLVHAAYPHLAVVVNEELQGLPEELAAPALAIRHTSTALLLGLIEDGIAAGVFIPTNVAVAAAAIGAMGLRVPYWFTAGESLEAQELADLQATLALRMLGRKE
jgi:AcrR family transcriptional regulator